LLVANYLDCEISAKDSIHREEVLTGDGYPPRCQQTVVPTGKLISRSRDNKRTTNLEKHNLLRLNQTNIPSKNTRTKKL